MFHLVSFRFVSFCFVYVYVRFVVVIVIVFFYSNMQWVFFVTNNWCMLKNLFTFLAIIFKYFFFILFFFLYFFDFRIFLLGFSFTLTYVFCFVFFFFFYSYELRSDYAAISIAIIATYLYLYILPVYMYVCRYTYIYIYIYGVYTCIYAPINTYIRIFILKLNSFPPSSPFVFLVYLVFVFVYIKKLLSFWMLIDARNWAKKSFVCFFFFVYNFFFFFHYLRFRLKLLLGDFFLISDCFNGFAVFFLFHFFINFFHCKFLMFRVGECKMLAKNQKHCWCF